ncbi:membrane protein [Clostridia bacterium]|nr:membrane protein [Clostridia bacterium]
MKKDKKFYTSIGGQAVMEGVMMRGPAETAIAVRKPDGEITVEKSPNNSITAKVKLFKWPLIRGCVSFIESMIVGTKALMFSASFFDLEGEPDEKPSKVEAWLENTFGDKLKDVIIGFSIVLSLLVSVGLFILLPTFITNFFHIQSNSLKTSVEGVIKIAIFLGYLVAVSQMKDIKRVFEYHGAEHKTIHCYEAGDALTPDNVRRHSRLHPRCGTSFLLIVLVVSIVTFILIPNGGALPWIARVGYKLLLLPLVAGIAYEIIRFAGRHNNRFTRIISAPGMAFQYITTREPDDTQIEVAIRALDAVKPQAKEDAKW